MRGIHNLIDEKLSSCKGKGENYIKEGRYNGKYRQICSFQSPHSPNSTGGFFPSGLILLFHSNKDKYKDDNNDKAHHQEPAHRPEEWS